LLVLFGVGGGGWGCLLVGNEARTGVEPLTSGWESGQKTDRRGETQIVLGAGLAGRKTGRA